MATEMSTYGTTPQPTDISAPVTPSVTPSLSFSNFRLGSTDSMSSLSCSTYYDTSPILRDFQEMTLSLTDDETNVCGNEALFVYSPSTQSPTQTNKTNVNMNDNMNNMNNTIENDEINNESNPFLMGLAINIPGCHEEIIEIESCDDDEDFECGNVTDFDCDLLETETVNCDRKFSMKKYEYICNIGIGAFGIVDKVFDHKNNRCVAIKQSRSIGDEILKQFRNEQNILHEFIDCDYIISIYDYGKNIDANQICLGLEYMDIGSLCNIRSYSMIQIKYICKCILHALVELHQLLYVHNDIKPENILISSNTNGNNVKLIDFGCTMQLLHANDKLTKSIGSIKYLSFEKRFCSPIQYNTKSDIYSFGITIAEIFNKKHYKTNKRNACGSYNHYFRNINNNIQLNNNKNAMFNDFISKTLIKDPSKRYSAQQLLKHPFLKNVPQKVQFQMPLN